MNYNHHTEAFLCTCIVMGPPKLRYDMLLQNVALAEAIQSRMSLRIGTRGDNHTNLAGSECSFRVNTEKLSARNRVNSSQPNMKISWSEAN